MKPRDNNEQTKYHWLQKKIVHAKNKINYFGQYLMLFLQIHSRMSTSVEQCDKKEL